MLRPCGEPLASAASGAVARLWARPLATRRRVDAFAPRMATRPAAAGERPDPMLRGGGPPVGGLVGAFGAGGGRSAASSAPAPAPDDAAAASVPDSLTDTQATHFRTLLNFFDKLDSGGGGRVQFGELEVGLDTLSSRIPSYYTMAHAIKEALDLWEGGLVKREEWVTACLKVFTGEGGGSYGEVFGGDVGGVVSHSTILPDLARAVGSLDREKVARRAEQRSLFGNSLMVPELGTCNRALLKQWSAPKAPSEEAPAALLEEKPPRGTAQGTRAALKDVLLRLFEHIDEDKDGRVDHGELEVSLDHLFSRAPGYYELTSNLLLALGDVGDIEALAVHRDDWLHACDQALDQLELTDAGAEQLAFSLPRLEEHVDALDPNRVHRRAKRRMIYGRSLDLPQLGLEEFPKQRIEGLSTQKLEMAGLRRFEPCLEGYSIVDATLGVGAFAKVFLVRNTSTGDLQAMKRIDRQKMQKTCNMSEEDVLRRIEHEFRHLQHTNHPHIIKLLEFRQDARYSYFVMEAANGGDLKKLVDYAYGRVWRRGKLVERGESSTTMKLSEAYVAHILEQVAYALHDLHREGRIHKDVKLENLMLLNREATPHVVLIDLGFMEMMPEERGEQLLPAGTPHTMAPEVIDTYLGRRPEGFDERCDIFSLGVVMFELLAGRPPYSPVSVGAQGPNQEIDYPETLATIRNVDVRAALKAHRSDAAADLVCRMMAPDPADRPSALECLRDSWVVRQGERRRRKSSLSTSLDAASSLDTPLGAVEKEERRRSVAVTAATFKRRSALQRAAAYHLAAQMPVSKLRNADEDLKAVHAGLGVEIVREELCRSLQERLGVDEACARYVAATLEAEDAIPEDFAEFAEVCAGLCAEREQSLVGQVFRALDASGDQGLTLCQALGALERAAIGRLNRVDVAEWLGAVLPGGVVPPDDGAKLSRQALENRFGYGLGVGVEGAGDVASQSPAGVGGL